jgi:type IV pilus assembly protein PilC
VGALAQKMMLTEVTRTMSLLIGAGVSVVEAINIVAEGAGNVIVKGELLKISKKVEKGFPVSISFSECPIFPPIVGQMMAVGEETGKMDEVLSKVSRYFESESEEKIKGLTTAIEPIILIIMAVGVGFLMYAVIMPMYSIMDKI